MAIGKGINFCQQIYQACVNVVTNKRLSIDHFNKPTNIVSAACQAAIMNIDGLSFLFAPLYFS